MSVWQGVAMESLKYLAFYAMQACFPITSHTAVSGVAHPGSGSSAAIFYPFGYPPPYAYGGKGGGAYGT
jgi:hypothetical protein